MQSTSSILPESIDNLDICLDDVLSRYDSMSMMDLDDTSRRLSSVSHCASLKEDVHDRSAPISATTDERQRYHALEKSYTYQNSSSSIDQHHLLETEKMERPDLGMIRARRSSSDDSSPTKKQHQPQKQQPSSPASCANTNTTMTLIAASRHANAATAAADTTTDDSSGSFMSLGNLAEGCKVFLFDSGNSNSLLNKSTEKLFSTGEHATLYTNLPSLALAESNFTAPLPPSLQEVMSMSSVMSISSFNMDSSLFMSDARTMQTFYNNRHTTTTSTTQEPQQQQQQQHQSDDDDDDNDANNDVETVVLPTMYDVICGKGVHTIQHNGHFIDMCEAKADTYAATRKRGIDGKQGIVMGIVHAIQEKQGRFLKQSGSIDGATTNSAQWQVLPLQGAIDKTSHCIRDILRRRKNEQQQQQQQQQRQKTARQQKTA